MRIELLSSSDREIAATRWQMLEAQLGNTTLTNSWHWIHAWLKHFGDDTPHRFVFGVCDGRTIGAALITKQNLLVPAVFLGTAGEPYRERTFVHYNRLLVCPDMLTPFADGLMQQLVQDRWSILRFDGFVPEHAAALMKAGKKRGVNFEERNSPALTFNFHQIETKDKDIPSAFSHHTRSLMRRSIRAFDIYGLQSTEWAETKEQACAILEELIALHTRQWNSRGELGHFSTERLQNYHMELISDLFPDRVILFRVKYGDITIGCLFNLIDEYGHITNHRSGIRLFTDNRLRAGFVTNILFMEEARKRGYAEYDLLSGSEEYKKRITNGQHSMVWALAGRGPGATAYKLIREIHRNPRVRAISNQIHKKSAGLFGPDRRGRKIDDLTRHDGQAPAPTPR